jgi:hypothetical protein
VGRDPISLDEFPVVHCTQCDLSYVNPRPDAEHLPAYYPNRYFDVLLQQSAPG